MLNRNSTKTHFSNKTAVIPSVLPMLCGCIGCIFVGKCADVVENTITAPQGSLQKYMHLVNNGEQEVENSVSITIPMSSINKGQL